MRRLKGRFIAKLGYYWFGFVFGYQLGEHLWTLTENFIETNFSAAQTMLTVVIGVGASIMGVLLVSLSEVLASKKPVLFMLLAGVVFFLGIALGFGGARLVTF